MTNVAVLYCKRIKDRSCIACAKCYKAMKEKNGFDAMPFIGFRVKLYSRGSGKWVESGGEKAKFGLTTTGGGSAIESSANAQTTMFLDITMR